MKPVSYICTCKFCCFFYPFAISFLTTLLDLTCLASFFLLWHDLLCTIRSRSAWPYVHQSWLAMTSADVTMMPKNYSSCLPAVIRNQLISSVCHPYFLIRGSFPGDVRSVLRIRQVGTGWNDAEPYTRCPSGINTDSNLHWIWTCFWWRFAINRSSSVVSRPWISPVTSVVSGHVLHWSLNIYVPCERVYYI